MPIADDCGLSDRHCSRILAIGGKYDGSTTSGECNNLRK